MILDNYENFIQKILDKLNEFGIDVSGLNMNHIDVKFHLTPVLEIVKSK